MMENTSIKKDFNKKSKSFSQDQISTDKSKANKTFDFASLHNKVGKKEGPQNETPKRTNKKHKQELDDSKFTSTPIPNAEKMKSLKSIMKNTPVAGDEPVEAYTPDYYANKRKKRNKSVSFVLEDETASKKSKPEDPSSEKSFKKSPKKQPISPVPEKTRKKERTKKITENGEKEQAEKENINVSQTTTSKNSTVKATPVKSEQTEIISTLADDANNNTEKAKRKKFKKTKTTKLENNDKCENETDKVVTKSTEEKHKKSNPENKESTEIRTKTETHEPAIKKNKKKKRKSKQANSTENGEPQSKTRKENNTEATAIVQDLGKLNIGDNAHKLTNLLDEMTVVDKNKKKKNNRGQEKKGKAGKKEKKISQSNTETADSGNIEEGKEKVKWQKRKWNKDKKADNEDFLLTSVIVDNLPLKIMLNYKKMLSEHFSKCGHINGVGIAEVYPTEEPKPVFTTTVHFALESEATRALEEDNTSFAGSRIKVKRPLPPTQTTLVVRSYGELTDQTVGSTFNGAGRIRNIRLKSKGKRTISSAFVEFDGPQSVERALKMATDVKIGGKNIYLSKFEIRQARKPKKENQAVKKVQEDKQESSDSDDE